MGFLQNTRKPIGFGGKLMVAFMNMGHSPMAKWGLSHIHPKSSHSALDIGCGGGANIRRLLQSCKYVTGIDYSEVSVDKSRKMNKAAIRQGRCKVLQGNVLKLPFAAASFDFVTAFETTYFWPDLEKAFCEVHRVLGKNGTFLITNEITDPEVSWVNVIEGMRVFPNQKMKELLLQAGFSNVQIFTKKEWVSFVARKVES